MIFQSARTLPSINRLFFHRMEFKFSKLASPAVRQKSSKSPATRPEVDPGRPVKFTASPAFNMGAAYRQTRQDDVPWFQQHIVTISVGSLLIYFCILRCDILTEYLGFVCRASSYSSYLLILSLIPGKKVILTLSSVQGLCTIISRVLRRFNLKLLCNIMTSTVWTKDRFLNVWPR